MTFERRGQRSARYLCCSWASCSCFRTTPRNRTGPIYGTIVADTRSASTAGHGPVPIGSARQRGT